MVEWFIAPVLKSKKVPGRESLTYEKMRTEASEKVPKRTCICQYAVNASSAEITQSGTGQLSLTFRPSIGAGRLLRASSVKMEALGWYPPPALRWKH